MVKKNANFFGYNERSCTKHKIAWPLYTWFPVVLVSNIKEIRHEFACVLTERERFGGHPRFVVRPFAHEQSRHLVDGPHFEELLILSVQLVRDDVIGVDVIGANFASHGHHYVQFCADRLVTYKKAKFLMKRGDISS